MDKISKRLVGWKSKFLSLGGHLVLIKHVLTTIPLYHLAAISPPKVVLLQLDILFAHFFWGAIDTHRRVWQSWERMSFPETENGLGVRSMLDVFKAYSCKIWWRWRNGLGIWAQFVASIGLGKSVNHRRLALVNELMRSNSRISVVMALTLFYTKNWS